MNLIVGAVVANFSIDKKVLRSVCFFQYFEFYCDYALGFYIFSIRAMTNRTSIIMKFVFFIVIFSFLIIGFRLNQEK